MLNDTELKNELGNLTVKEQVKFMKLLETFNHKGGSSSNSKVNRALNVARYKKNRDIQGGGGNGIFSEFKNMFGGVSEKINSLKKMATPKILQDINNEIEEEEKTNEENSQKLEGGKLNKNNNNILLNKDNNVKLEERVGKLENSISLLNETLNNMNDDGNNDNNDNNGNNGNDGNNGNNDNNNNNLQGGGRGKKNKSKKKKKNNNKSKKKKSKSKSKRKHYKRTKQKKK